MRCGECGCLITAENKVKRQKTESPTHIFIITAQNVKILLLAKMY